MKIYTKQGDKGQTGLFGGGRVSKADLRVEAYGTVDELNACVGWAMTQLAGLPVVADLQRIQSDLFVLGADLATSPDAAPAVAARSVRIQDAHVTRLEQLIDGWDADLPPLRKFILPGGSPGAASIQVCRGVCRRAERCTVRLAAEESISPTVVMYLNRLSDLLFVLARWINCQQGIQEPVWEG